MLHCRVRMLLKPVDTTVTHQRDPESTDIVTEGEAKNRVSNSLRVAHRTSLTGNYSLNHSFCILSFCTLNKVVHSFIVVHGDCVASAFDVSGVAVKIFSPFAQVTEEYLLSIETYGRYFIPYLLTGMAGALLLILHFIFIRGKNAWDCNQILYKPLLAVAIG